MEMRKEVEESVERDEIEKKIGSEEIRGRIEG